MMVMWGLIHCGAIILLFDACSMPSWETLPATHRTAKTLSYSSASENRPSGVK